MYSWLRRRVARPAVNAPAASTLVRVVPTGSLPDRLRKLVHSPTSLLCVLYGPVLEPIFEAIPFLYKVTVVPKLEGLFVLIIAHALLSFSANPPARISILAWF